MKKIVNVIKSSLIKLILFVFMLILVLLICTYIFSTKNGLAIEDAISYLKIIANEVMNSDSVDEITVNNNVSIGTISTGNTTYYYNQLDNTAKIIYDSFENNIDNLKKENHVIDFSTSFNDLLNEHSGQYKLNKSFQSALDAFFYDHPELFYIDLSKISLNTKSISLGPIKTYTVEIAPKNSTNYLSTSFKSEQEVNNAINQVERIRDSIINTVSTETNIYNKILNIHDLLVNSIEYDTTLNKSNIHNIYGALVEKKVVCEGYAKAFKYLLDSLDIECILVSGTATNSSNQTESHMWNYVKLNGSWYGVDVTWDDPIIIGQSIIQYTRHDYFLKGYRTFISSHIPSGRISDTGVLFTLPILSDTNFKK